MICSSRFVNRSAVARFSAIGIRCNSAVDANQPMDGDAGPAKEKVL